MATRKRSRASRPARPDIAELKRRVAALIETEIGALIDQSGGAA